mgnify:CR=1 FL=1
MRVASSVGSVPKSGALFLVDGSMQAPRRPSSMSSGTVASPLLVSEYLPCLPRVTSLLVRKPALTRSPNRRDALLTAGEQVTEGAPVMENNVSQDQHAPSISQHFKASVDWAV